MKAIIYPSLLSVLLVFEIPQTQAQIPIGELKQNAGVTIEGEIRRVFGNKFTLSDGTGEILVDGGPSWYHQLNLRQGEIVTVVGEYDDDDFDAYQITRRNGKTIQIRDPQGPPPWAGGSRPRRLD